MKKVVSLLLSIVMIIGVLFGLNLNAYAKSNEGSWVKDNYGWRYVYEDGTYAKDDIYDIGNGSFYFNEEGYMITGWRYINQVWFYFEPSGYMVKGWKNISGSYYYFDKDGEMAYDKFVYDEDETGEYIYNIYYVDENGVWIPNKWMKNSVGYWYLFGDGTYPRDDGIVEDGRLYFFDRDGYLRIGHFTIGGYNFYSNEQGYLVGWHLLGNGWHYLNSSGYPIRNTWQYIDGYWYFFDEYGVIYTGLVNIAGEKFFFNESGQMITGWRYIENNWYYFNSEGYMQKYWQKIGNKWYYFDSTGVMQTNQYIEGFYVDSNGVWIP